MTTIAVDADGNIASDSRASNGTSACSVKKLIKMSGGRVAGLSDDLGKCLRVIAWIEAGEEAPQPSMKDVCIIIVGPLGAVLIEEGWPPHPVDLPMAIGSGEQAAKVAMSYGCSARQAVKEAIKHDPASHGPVINMRYRRK